MDIEEANGELEDMSESYEISVTERASPTRASRELQDPKRTGRASSAACSLAVVVALLGCGTAAGHDGRAAGVERSKVFGQAMDGAV